MKQEDLPPDSVSSDLDLQSVLENLGSTGDQLAETAGWEDLSATGNVTDLNFLSVKRPARV